MNDCASGDGRLSFFVKTDIGYCYRILNKGTSFVGASAFPKTLTELTLHGVQMSEDLLIEVLNQLPYVKVLTLCGLRSVDDDTLNQVSPSISP